MGGAELSVGGAGLSVGGAKLSVGGAGVSVGGAELRVILEIDHMLVCDASNLSPLIFWYIHFMLCYCIVKAICIRTYVSLIQLKVRAIQQKTHS